MGYQTIKIIYGLAAILGTLAIILFSYQYISGRVNKKTAIFNLVGNKVKVEIAETFSQKLQGLSGRASLENDSGMLFVYPNKSILHFWMKDMNFPLDVVWMADGKVVGWQENIPPPAAGQITRFQSNAPADMVLEVNAGWIAAHDLQSGDAAGWD